VIAGNYLARFDDYQYLSLSFNAPELMAAWAFGLTFSMASIALLSLPRLEPNPPFRLFPQLLSRELYL
jgi:hypothetical protein